MNRLITAVFALLVAMPLPALAQGAYIALSSQEDGGNCSIVSASSGVVRVHIVVLDANNISAIQFAAPQPACWTNAALLSEDITTELVIGDTQDPVRGLSAAWGTCLQGTLHVGTLSFFATGPAPDCCDYPILKAQDDGFPEIPGPIAVVCLEDSLAVEGVPVTATINPTPSCDCTQGPLAVEESTWGRVKALYR